MRPVAGPPQTSSLKASSLFRNGIWIERSRRIERLRKENERAETGNRTPASGTGSSVACQQASSRAAFAWQHQKPTPSGRAVSQAAATAGRRAAPSHRAWMNRSRFLCRSTARIAAAAWSRKAAKRSIRKRLSGGPWCAVSISLWAAAASASGGCRDAIRCRPRMRWESATCSWGRRR